MTARSVANFYFEGLRDGVLVQFSEDLERLLEPNKEKAWTYKKLEDIPQSFDTRGPFNVVTTLPNGKIEDVWFSHFVDAIKNAGKICDGSHAYIFDIHHDEVAKIDAT